MGWERPAEFFSNGVKSMNISRDIIEKIWNSIKQSCVAMGIFCIVNDQPKYWNYSLYLLSLRDGYLGHILKIRCPFWQEN